MTDIKALLREAADWLNCDSHHHSEVLAKRLEAAAESLGEPVPEGFVLLPVEPTPEMLKALLKGARIRSYNRKGMNVNEWSYVREGWDAMLATIKEQGHE